MAAYTRAQLMAALLGSLSAFAYETAYLGFLWVAHFNDHTDGTIEVELVSSSDGVNWTRAPAGPDGLRPAVLPRGLSPHASTSTAWDGMMVFTPNHPLVEGPEIKLFYEGCSNSHHGGADKCGVGIATMRQQRNWCLLSTVYFLSLDALAVSAWPR
jgi:hypothetical protein